jgi:hypothetical protein
MLSRILTLPHLINIRELDGADDFLARRFGLVQPTNKDFVRNWHMDYQWDEGGEHE